MRLSLGALAGKKSSAPGSIMFCQTRVVPGNERGASWRTWRNVALKAFTDKSLPTDLVDYFLGDDDEKTSANVTKLATAFETYAQTVKTGLLKDNGRVPQKSTDPSSKFFSIEQINEMSAPGNLAEFDRNYDKIQESLAYHNANREG